MLITNKLESSQRKRTVKRQISIGPLTLRFITVIILASLCILYLAQSTQGATQNYRLRELEQTKYELEKENERLSVEATRLQALKKVDVSENEDDDKKMEEVDEVEYLE